MSSRFAISCLLVILSRWRCEQDKESEDGVREHTKSYVTEGYRKLDTVLRHISAARASNIVLSSRVNHNHRPNLFRLQLENVLTFGGALIYRDIFGVDCHTFFIHAY